MFHRENGAALAWLLLFVLLVGGAVYDRVSDRSALPPHGKLMALR